MMSAVDELYLENLDEFVNDENRVVTYKWLSYTLKVHVNQAKQMLYSFCELQRNKKDNDISVTYFVVGTTTTHNEDQQEYKYAVVAEEQLDAYKSSLAVVHVVHIYSVQKSKLKDSNALYIADFDGIKENILHSNQFSAVQCSRAKARTQDEMSFKQAHVTQEVQSKVSNVCSTNGSSAVTVSNKAKKTEPKGSIASMFAGSKKTGSDKSTEQPSHKQSTDAKNKKAKEPKGGIAAMFSGVSKTTVPKQPQAAKSEREDNQKQEKDKSEKEKSKSEKEKSKSEKEKSKSEKEKSKSEKEKSKSEKEKSKSEKEKPKSDKNVRAKKKASSCSDDESKPDKKRRRRIKADLFDSSSDDGMECLEESPIPSPVREISPEPESPTAEPESPIPESPIPEPVEERLSEGKSEQKNTGERKRRRTRKLVPKTYMDESGFMVTEKVWESDSTDVSEVEEIPAKQVKKKQSPNKETAPTKKQGKGKKSPQKKSPPSGKTQASLTSFFRKT